MNKLRVKEHFSEAATMLQIFLANEINFEKITSAGNILVTALKTGNKIISCGNGGSMCDAMHFAEELSGKYREDRAALPAISISDASYISCVANDYGYNKVFARFIEGFANKGDVLLAISTSGNSENVINAIKTAKQKGLFIIGLTGKDGGAMAHLCDIEVRAPYSKYADRAQEIHIKVIHSLIDFVESAMALE